jgi:hypothetical protein
MEVRMKGHGGSLEKLTAAGEKTQKASGRGKRTGDEEKAVVPPHLTGAPPLPDRHHPERERRLGAGHLARQRLTTSDAAMV